MPTTYTGVSTGTESGDTAPAPEKVPVLNIPIAGELITVSSILSALKNLANHISWTLAPKAKLSDFAKWILAFRHAGGHKRFLVDHLGLPAGRVVHWIEDWSRGMNLDAQISGSVDIDGGFGQTFLDRLQDVADSLVDCVGAADLTATQTLLGAAGSGLSAALLDARAMEGGRPWRHRVVKTTGSSFVHYVGPDANTNRRHRYVILGAGDTQYDYSILWRRMPCTFSDEVTVYLEWTTALAATGMGSKLVTMGGFAPENDPPDEYGFGSGQHYAIFALGASGNWFAKTRAGGAITSTDTGVAPSTSWTRFRVEFHGATVGEAAARTVYFYINGTKVAEHTTNVPAAATSVAPMFTLGNYVGGAHGLTDPVRISPVQLAHNLLGADVS